MVVPQDKTNSQLAKFKEATRELESENDKTRLDERLNKIVKAPIEKPSKDQTSSE